MTLKQIREDKRVYEVERIYGEDFKYEVSLEDGYQFDDESSTQVYNTVKEIEQDLKNVICIKDNKYLIVDNRLSSSEQDLKGYTLEELKEYFKMDLDKVNSSDLNYFADFNVKLNRCNDIGDIDFLLKRYGDDCFRFKEVD